MKPQLSNCLNGISAPLSVSGKADGGTNARPDAASKEDINAKRLADALGNASMGIICSFCGSGRVIRAGSCGACLDCGTSTGC